jgi:hypothetical protein
VQRVGRGGSPAVIEKHPPEVRRVEEDTRLPLQPAVDAQMESIRRFADQQDRSWGPGVNQSVHVCGGVETVAPEEGDELPETMPQQSAAGTPRHCRQRSRFALGFLFSGKDKRKGRESMVIKASPRRRL